ncbi:MAG TPA: hypothetical protein VGZ03_00990 [Acidimicrobiales bacterium]|nr:hypothetical protein [Acidimicrobiales bacterium]
MAESRVDPVNATLDDDLRYLAQMGSGSVGSRKEVVRSSLAERLYVTWYFAACIPLFIWAAVSRTPGSAFSQSLGHIVFSLAAAGCAFMTVRAFRMGYLEITDSEIRFSSIRGTHAVRLTDVTAVTSAPDYHGYVVTPVLKLRSGKSMRLSDFGSAIWTLRRHPATCSCGRALRAIESSIATTAPGSDA